MHDRSIKLRYGRNLVTKHSTFSYPSCDYIIYFVVISFVVSFFVVISFGVLFVDVVSQIPIVTLKLQQAKERACISLRGKIFSFIFAKRFFQMENSQRRNKIE